MSARPPIYAASQENAAEVRRALRICLGGTSPPAALTFEGGDFAGWSARLFMPVLATHAVAAFTMALRGDVAGMTAADRLLKLPPASSEAGRRLLDARRGARHLPAGRRFAAAVAAGETPGHFATVMALQAADFSIAVLPLVQCLLYCEWRAGQPPSGLRDLDDFLRHASGTVPSLTSLISPHEQAPDIPFSRVR